MKKIISFFILTLIFLLSGCDFINKRLEKKVKNVLTEIRENAVNHMTEEQKENRRMYYAIEWYENNPLILKELLENGHNPDLCFGECGWIESNPLLLVAESHYTTYYRLLRGEKIPNPTPDVQVLNLLIDYGADISLYPYVFVIVYDSFFIGKKGYKEQVCYVEDTNRLLKAFLDRGADVNAKGNGKAFDWQTYKDELSYNEFKKMCRADDATTPLYEAIKKGMMWESQVDLLLEYGAILDESCLRAAELSNDKEMVKKIESIYYSHQ